MKPEPLEYAYHIEREVAVETSIYEYPCDCIECHGLLPQMIDLVEPHHKKWGRYQHFTEPLLILNFHVFFYLLWFLFKYVCVAIDVICLCTLAFFQIVPLMCSNCNIHASNIYVFLQWLLKFDETFDFYYKEFLVFRITTKQSRVY